MSRGALCVVAPGFGALASVSTGTGANSSTTEYTSFDILGRVTASKQTTEGGDTNGYTSSYVYNLSGALIEQTYPSGRKVRNDLDASGDLEKVDTKKNSNHSYYTFANRFTYNAAGAVTSMQLGNGRWESTQFNSRLQPTQIALGATQGTTNLLKLDYSYGTTANDGNVLSQTITVPTVGTNTDFTAVQNYNYDSLNRLKDATENITPHGGSQTQSWKQTFTFDRFGNRRFDFTSGATTTPESSYPEAVCNPAVNPSNNRINAAGYLFDAAGNTTRDAGDRKFTCDAENKQVKVESLSPGTQTVTGTIGEYWYDGDGRRVKKRAYTNNVLTEETIFVYDAAGKLIAEYSNQVASSEDAKVAYLTNDHLGSPRINTDINGNITARHDYHPFGEEIATSQRTSGLGYAEDTVRKQFTGYDRDNESELDFAQARMFSYSHGRFTSVDSVGPDFKNPQTLNKFQYCLNNPLRYVDKTGKYEEDVHRDLTNLLAYAAGFTAKQSAQIADANQKVDDVWTTGPFWSHKSREDFHFTTEERRGELWSAFEKEASRGGRDSQAMSALGQFFHAQQDSFSHSGYGPGVGHTFGWKAVDKTDERPALAEDMAKDSFQRLVLARNAMAKSDRAGTLYRPISYNAVKGMISRWVRESDPEKKKKLGEEIRRKIQNGRDIQRDDSTARRTVRAPVRRVRGEE